MSQWILDKYIIEKEYKERGFKIPSEILSIEDENLRSKLSEVWKFIFVNFQTELIDGVKAKTIRTALFKYAYNSYYAETKGVDETLQLLAQKGLGILFDKETNELFFKKK